MLLIWNDQLIRTSPARCEIDADFVGKLSSSTSVILLIIKCHTNVIPLLPAHGTVHQTGIPVLQLWYMLHKYDVIRCSEDSGLCIPMHSKTGASTARQKEQHRARLLSKSIFLFCLVLRRLLATAGC